MGIDYQKPDPAVMAGEIAEFLGDWWALNKAAAYAKVPRLMRPVAALVVEPIMVWLFPILARMVLDLIVNWLAKRFDIPGAVRFMASRMQPDTHYMISYRSSAMGKHSFLRE